MGLAEAVGSTATEGTLTTLRKLRQRRGGRLWLATRPGASGHGDRDGLLGLRQSLWRDDAAAARAGMHG